MKPNIQIENNAGVCRIDIEGTIGVPEQWQFDEPDERVATYEKFRQTVARIAEIDAAEVVVEIRSTGGDVNDALLIHDALRSLEGRITTRCYGYTASAATLIAQAASEGCREISANALYLIHNSVCAAEGNAAELAARLDLLRSTDERIAAVYAARSGRSAEEFAALMAANNGNGRWLSPQEALAAGLADRIVGSEANDTDQHVKGLVRGWERLLEAVGLREEKPDVQPVSPADAELPADRNVLHFDDDRQQEQQRAAAAEKARAAAGPTRTKPREDPSYGDTLRSANERAYAADARRLRSL